MEALHYFRDKGLITQLKDGKKIFGQYGPFYIVASFPKIQEACKEIHDAGEIAILAHPGRVLKNLDLTEFERAVRRVTTQCIDGIESYYPTHSKEIIDICNEFNLQITAGQIVMEK